MSDDGARVVRADEREWTTEDRGEFGFRRAKLGAAAGGERLGCSRYELPPGKRSFPLHYHLGNEEALYVLSGTGTLRTGTGTIELAAGDYVACPVGEDGTHQVVNESDDTLTYLVISTMDEPDVTVYPDSNKVGLFAGAPPGGNSDERTLHTYLDADAQLDYYDGEP